jgi:hypothetical protein
MSIPAGSSGHTADGVPSPTGLVSVPELASYMSDTTFNPSQEQAIATILIGVQQELEEYLNRPVQIVQVREYIQCDVNGYANVKYAPVTKIISMTQLNSSFSGWENEFTIAFEPPEFVRDISLSADAQVDDAWGTEPFGKPIVVPGAIYFGVPGVWIAVEYLAGYNGYRNEQMRLGIMRVAAREVTGLHDNTLSLREGSAEPAANPDPRPKGWQPEELAAFDRYRRRVVV